MAYSTLFSKPRVDFSMKLVSSENKRQNTECVAMKSSENIYCDRKYACVWVCVTIIEMVSLTLYEERKKKLNKCAIDDDGDNVSSVGPCQHNKALIRI